MRSLVRVLGFPSSMSLYECLCFETHAPSCLFFVYLLKKFVVPFRFMFVWQSLPLAVVLITAVVIIAHFDADILLSPSNLVDISQPYHVADQAYWEKK
mmetsp:Transcript_12212/g.13636  ORF Transcript_12212/g.13636 Transcript_12212/m.13636 type:complete len:98 (+) Transcript_12212:85-378(+)